MELPPSILIFDPRAAAAFRHAIKLNGDVPVNRSVPMPDPAAPITEPINVASFSETWTEPTEGTP